MPKARERVGHDGTIPAQLVELAHEFHVRAVACGCGESLGESGDGGQAQILLGAFALVHDVENLVHETIQADEGIDLSGRGRRNRSIVAPQLCAVQECSLLIVPRKLRLCPAAFSRDLLPRSCRMRSRSSSLKNEISNRAFALGIPQANFRAEPFAQTVFKIGDMRVLGKRVLCLALAGLPPRA